MVINLSFVLKKKNQILRTFLRTETQTNVNVFIRYIPHSLLFIYAPKKNFTEKQKIVSGTCLFDRTVKKKKSASQMKKQPRKQNNCSH